jgi:hypothetical protein
MKITFLDTLINIIVNESHNRELEKGCVIDNTTTVRILDICQRNSVNHGSRGLRLQEMHRTL